MQIHTLIIQMEINMLRCKQTDRETLSWNSSNGNEVSNSISIEALQFHSITLCQTSTAV